MTKFHIHRGPINRIEIQYISGKMMRKNFNFDLLKRYFKISLSRENEAIKHDLVDFKVQCLKVFCYHRNNSTTLLFSIFRTTPEVSGKLYFVEIC